MDPLVAQGDGVAHCYVCRKDTPIKDGERAQKCCGVWPAIHDRVYWEAIEIMNREED